MTLYYILYISFILIPITIVSICKYSYPNQFKSYKEIFANTYILIIAVALLFMLIKILIATPDINMNIGIGNVYLHAIGGGVACSLLFLYIIKCLDVYIPWLFRFAMFFMFLSALGVCNELLEFGLEYFRLGSLEAMSPSPRDTRQDLFANTVGGTIGFIITQIFYTQKSKELYISEK